MGVLLCPAVLECYYYSELIIAYPIPKGMEVILFNLWSQSDVPLVRQELAIVLFCAARCVLANHWKQATLPSVGKLWEVFFD